MVIYFSTGQSRKLTANAKTAANNIAFKFNPNLQNEVKWYIRNTLTEIINNAAPKNIVSISFTILRKEVLNRIKSWNYSK
jgi:hypothetical protein